LLLGSILLFIGLLGSKTTKYGIPILLLFLFVGMLAGSDGIGGISFNEPETAKFIGVIALSFILFSGGLDTRWGDIKPVIWQGITLSTLGVVLTAVIVGVFVSLVTELSLLEGLLLGSIVSSTDAAAVFSILRSRSIALKGNLRPLLELESGSNDPMAYFLTIVFTYLLTNQDASYVSLVPMFFRQMILGGLIGYLMGLVMQRTINWINLEFDGLYSVLLITLMLFTFSFTDFIGGNGFLAIYISACVLGNREFIHKKSLIKHFDGQAWLMQAIMFITLGLLVFPSQIIPYIGVGLLISITLILLARPLSVYISLFLFKISNRKKLFVSWVGLRGAVPIVLATYPLTAGVANANVIFDLVFFISITSILLQGTTLPVVAKWLRLTLPAEVKKATSLDKDLNPKIKSIMTTVIIEPSCPCLGKALVTLQLGSSNAVTAIQRNGRFITPDGFTKIQVGDELSIMSDDLASLIRVKNILGINA
jgi:cell volume regulation protein A